MTAEMQIQGFRQHGKWEDMMETGRAGGNSRHSPKEE